jgi:PAS domain S-box-containing protein
MGMSEPRPVRALLLELGAAQGTLVERLASITIVRFEVTAVRTLAAALEQLGLRAFDLVILGRALAHAGTLGELRALGGGAAGAPVIVVTDDVDGDDGDARAAAQVEGAEEVYARAELASRLFAINVQYIVEQRRLREQRQQLDALLECAPSFILAVDRKGIIQFINRTLPHFERDRVVGSDWLNYITEDRRHEVSEKLTAVLLYGAPQTYDTTIVGPDGQPLWFTSYIGPVRHGDQIVGAVVVAQDATESRRAQADLLAAQRLASVGTLAAGIAHEINTPVQFVSDSVNFLRNAVEDMFRLLRELRGLRDTVVTGAPVEEAAAACAAAEEEADLPYLQDNVPAAFDRCVDGLSRVATIVRSLKEFAHPSGKEMSAVDLNRAIQSTLTIARNEYKYVADLEVDFGDVPRVTCHVDEINQVVLNMVVNAAHAIQDVVRGTNAKGLIQVRTTREDDDVLIAIRDTGGGIPADVLPRIFDPFFTTKMVGKGTGQGLAIARTIVRQNHRGEISVDTRAGEGTTFLIRLPIRQPAATDS